MAKPGQSELDTKVGTEPKDIIGWTNEGARWRPDNVSTEDKLPIKAMPFREREKPYRIKGAGGGG